jgi:hypothetical protein
MLGQVLVSSLLIAGCLLAYQTCMREAAAKRPGVLNEDGKMWNKNRLLWINDGLNQTLVAAAIFGTVVLSLILARGWAL